MGMDKSKLWDERYSEGYKSAKTDCLNWIDAVNKAFKESLEYSANHVYREAIDDFYKQVTDALR